jgi:phage shock protein B
MEPEAIFGMFLGLVAILSIFVALPWMILHYTTKNKKAGSLSEEEHRMLEDLWRSARAMERRVETLERLIEADGAAPVRPASERMRGDFN